MDALYSAHGHPTPETLEEYAFQRLSDAELDVLEEHLLACADCQTALADIDEYILLMKVATARPAPAAQPQHYSFNKWDYAVGGMALLFALGVAVVQWPATAAAGPPQVVQLEAVRGGDIAMNHAPAHRPVDLALDVTGLTQPDGQYRVDIVTPTGAVTWTGVLKPGATDPIQSVHLPRGLPAGVYWVRVSMIGAGPAGDQLLREFGLKAD